MSKQNKNRILGYFFKEALRYKKPATAIFLIVPTSILLMRYIAPLLIAQVLLSIQTGTVTLENSWWIVVLYFLINIVTEAGYRLVLWLMWGVQIKGAAHLYEVAYDKLSRHSLSFYSDTFTGSLVSKVNRFTASFIQFWDAVTYQVLFIITSVLATVIGLAIFVWQYALIVLILTIIFAFCAYFGTRFMRQRYKERSESYTEISGKLADSVGNMLAVKTDAREQAERKLLRVSINNMFDKEMATRSSFTKVSTVYSIIMTLMRSGALVAAVLSIQSGIGNAAVVYICLTYTFNLLEEIWNINNLLRTYYQITGDAAETLEILDQPESIKDKTSIKLKVKTPTIEFQDISFAHDAKKKDEDAPHEPDKLFESFALKIPQNQKVGLVGVSGSGKSTLLKLLMRFYDVDEGRILVDGHDISRVTQQSLHQNIAYVPQEPLLFHRSLWENIAYARPDASMEEVRAAAAQANALEFIDQLPDGFDTLVGERGVKLSGGQRQRVAIARAILKDAPILVLDEATSALDSESEKLIQEALQKLMKGRTSIVIAHRLSTIAKLDRIVVLENGAIIEDGAHEELLKANGVYARLWAHQSGGFIEE